MRLSGRGRNLSYFGLEVAGRAWHVDALHFDRVVRGLLQIVREFEDLNEVASEGNLKAIDRCELGCSHLMRSLYLKAPSVEFWSTRSQVSSSLATRGR